MKERRVKIGGSSRSRTLGIRAFAAISRVEGLRLSSESKKRLAMLRRSKLSRGEQRAAVIQAYRKPKLR